MVQVGKSAITHSGTSLAEFLVISDSDAKSQVLSFEDNPKSPPITQEDAEMEEVGDVDFDH